ncbi:hypothetical protein TSMEX_004080 [Taenia solium]|eukprot:TsM_000227800 transcript=TsM_000227800 gene=TsM_000227800
MRIPGIAAEFGLTLERFLPDSCRASGWMPAYPHFLVNKDLCCEVLMHRLPGWTADCVQSTRRDDPLLNAPSRKNLVPTFTPRIPGVNFMTVHLYPFSCINLPLWLVVQF